MTDHRPTIVCLIGSTRFKGEFIAANFAETMAGRIVLTVGWFSHADADIYTPTEREKASLDDLHLRKVDLCDEVLVISVDNYIGSSTRRELDYAIARGKTIRYWETERAVLSPAATPNDAVRIAEDHHD